MQTRETSAAPRLRNHPTIASALTKLPVITSSARCAASSPWTPALVRSTSVRPSSSARRISAGELEKSKPGKGLPSRSPASSSAGSARFSASASSGVATGRMRAAPRAMAHGASVKARNTSMTTATPSARRAPSSRCRIRTSGPAAVTAVTGARPDRAPRSAPQGGDSERAQDHTPRAIIAASRGRNTRISSWIRIAMKTRRASASLMVGASPRFSARRQPKNLMAG